MFSVQFYEVYIHFILILVYELVKIHVVIVRTRNGQFEFDFCRFVLTPGQSE